MNRFFSVVLLAAALALPACQFDSGIVVCEDGQTPGPSPTVPTSLQQVYAQLGAPVQTFTYDPTRTNTFTGSQGTRVTIPANAFVKNGVPVTGPLQLTLREIFSRADMILSNMPAVSGGRALVSAGEVFLRPAQDTSIRMAPGLKLLLTTRNPASTIPLDSMKLFVGTSGGTPTGTPTTSCFNWQLNADTTSRINQVPGGYAISVSSILFNKKLDWFNCDRFYNSPLPLAPVEVNVPGANIDPATNTMVFAVCRTFNGCIRVCDFTPPGSFHSSGIPIGTPLSVVVIRTVRGKLYYGRQDSTLRTGMIFSPKLQLTVPQALRAELNLL